MGAVGTTLGSLNASDPIFKFVGVFWLLMAIVAVSFALGLYRWRVHKLQNRHSMHTFGTTWGPVLLSLLFVFAVLCGSLFAFFDNFVAEAPKPVIVVSAEVDTVTSSSYQDNYRRFMPDNLELSGLAYHKPSGLLYVLGDFGVITVLDPATRFVKEMWSLPRDDYEAITFVDHPDYADRVYVGLENKPGFGPGIAEVSLSTHAILRMVKLPGFPMLKNAGMEAMTFVPLAFSSDLRGFFYCGSQADGSVYIYEIPIWDTTQPVLVATLQGSRIAPSPSETLQTGINDLSDMSFFSYLENDGRTLTQAQLSALSALRQSVSGSNAPASPANVALVTAVGFRCLLALSYPTLKKIMLFALDPFTALPLVVPPASTAQIAVVAMPSGEKDIEGILFYPSPAGDVTVFLSSDSKDTLSRWTYFPPTAALSNGLVHLPPPIPPSPSPTPIPSTIPVVVETWPEGFLAKSSDIVAGLATRIVTEN